MKIWVLTEYEYCTYSFSGLDIHDVHYHVSEDGAKAHAEKLGLKPCEYCRDPRKECTIHPSYLLD